MAGGLSGVVLEMWNVIRYSGYGRIRTIRVRRSISCDGIHHVASCRQVARKESKMCCQTVLVLG